MYSSTREDCDFPSNSKVFPNWTVSMIWNVWNLLFVDGNMLFTIADDLNTGVIISENLKKISLSKHNCDSLKFFLLGSIKINNKKKSIKTILWLYHYKQITLTKCCLSFEGLQYVDLVTWWVSWVELYSFVWRRVHAVKQVLQF